MSSIRHALDVYMIYVSASSVLCTSRNSLANMQHTVHVRTTYDYASKYFARRETRWHQYDPLCTFKDIRLRVVRTVHVARPDSLHTTLGFVAKLDGVHTTHCARASRRCTHLHVAKPECFLTILRTFIRHSVVRTVHVAKPYVVNTTIRHCARSYDIPLPVVLTVHVVKPDGVQTILGSVAKQDGVNPTRCRRLFVLRLCIERTVHVAQFTGGHATHCARSYDLRLCDVPTVHVAKPDDVQTTLGSVAIQDIPLGVVRTVHVAKPYAVGVVCNVHLAKPDGVHTIPRRGVVRTAHVAIRHTVHVYTTLRLGVVHSVYVAKPDVVNPTRCRHLYDLHLCHVRTVHVAKTRQCSYDTSLCRDTRWRPYDM